MQRTNLIKIFIFIGLLSFAFNIVFKRSICIFFNIFGIPCVTCGLTRAYISLLKLDIESAFYYHPLFFLVPFFFIVKKKKYFLMLFGLFVVVWLVRMWLYFPYREPMVFNSQALYIQIFYFFKNLLIKN